MIPVPISTEEQKACWKKYPVKVMIGKSGINPDGKPSNQCNDLFYSKEGDSTRISLRELIKVAQNFKDFRDIEGNVLDMDLFIVVGDIPYGLGVEA